MKERYNVEISDVHLTIVSDEPEEFVNATVEKISDRVNELIVRNKRCSKLDAALLCALDYCGEYAKAERRIRNLEAQISLYDANLKRLREEIAQKGGAPDSVKSALGIASSDEAPKKGAHDRIEEPKKTDNDTVSMLDDSFDAPKPATPANESGIEGGATKAKIAEIEQILRKPFPKVDPVDPKDE